AKGSFRCAFTVPEATAGSHTVTALDTTYTNSAEASYTVNPAISLNATNGTVGSSAGVSGRGFAPNNPITVTFDGSGVATACVANATRSSNYCAFTGPAADAGSHTVTASDRSANSAPASYTYSAAASYTVNSTISLNATAGAVDSAVTLSGSNFKPNSTITVTFDGTALGMSGACTADASGNLPASSNCAFTIPAAAA